MSLEVEVCFALPDRQVVIAVMMDSQSTIEQAIRQSEILDQGLGIDLQQNPVGIFGIKRPLDWLLQDHDRIEIYRPLTVSPTEARRLRAAAKN